MYPTAIVYANCDLDANSLNSFALSHSHSESMLHHNQPTHPHSLHQHQHPMVGFSKKRKAASDTKDFDDDSLSSLHRSKICFARRIELDQEAPFHPLPPDLNAAILASLGHDPFSPSTPSTTSASTLSNSIHGTINTGGGGDGGGHHHQNSNASDYFSNGKYPDLDIYSSAAGIYGILGPQNGSFPPNSMEVDCVHSQPQGHGPHCKSIPQLSVRHTGNSTSELWATCSDCGACSKVDSN